jgi:hypothetical protein
MAQKNFSPILVTLIEWFAYKSSSQNNEKLNFLYKFKVITYGKKEELQRLVQYEASVMP